VVGHRPHDRRMAIEEQLRDSQGTRFGVRLEWTQFRTPALLNRFMLLLGVALMIWTAVGAAAVHREPTAQWPRKTKSPRLSLATIGTWWLHRIRSGAYLGLDWIRSYLPLPSFRFFDWLPPPFDAKQN